MKLNELIKNIYNRIFCKDIFWSTFLLNLILGLVVFFIFILFLGFDFSAYLNLLNPDFVNDVYLLELIKKYLIHIICFFIILLYLQFVLYAFILFKISKKKSKHFFENLGKSFYKGLLLFFGFLIFSFIATIILLLTFLFLKIPYFGLVLSILFFLILVVFFGPGYYILLGKIFNGSFFDAILSALVLPFKKIGLTGKFWVLNFILLFVFIISSLLEFIPFVGLFLYFIFILFLNPAIMIYTFSIIYDFSKE